MTVTMFSFTPPTTSTSRYLLRPTVLNGPRDTILDDIDDWYSPQIEDDGFLERLDRSAEIVRFP